MVTTRQFQESAGADWRVLAFEGNAWFPAPSHRAGAALVSRIADLAEGVDLRSAGVQVRVGLADADKARAISRAAAALGLTADPVGLQTVQLTVDALDKSAVMPFWQAALDYAPMGDEDLVDPLRRDPEIWFQPRDAPRPLRNRIHLDVVRPHELTAATLGTLAAAVVRRGDHHALVADPEGNEADLLWLTAADRLDDSEETADWRALFGAMAFYPTGSPAQAAELAVAVAGLADDAGIPLMIDLRPPGVTIDSGKDRWEHEAGFVDLARRIQAAARGLGLTADPARLRFVQLGFDAVDLPAVREFWRAALGYELDPRPQVTDINDPRRLGPTLFFQPMEDDGPRRKQRNRIHFDLYVPEEQAQARVDAAVAAGGRIVRDEHARGWWTIADPEGNELDIAVVLGRDDPK